MRGLGTIINIVTVLVGATIGLLLKGGLPERFEKTVKSAAGLSTIIIGVTGTLSEMFSVLSDGSISVNNIMLLVISLVLGAIIGEWIDIEEKLERVGNFCKNKARFLAKDNPKFVEGFVSTSLLFCVGAMAIVGSIQDGLVGDYTILAAKSVLDGVISVVLAASLGGGVLLSVIPVAIYQGGITILATFLEPFMTDVLISNMSLVGSVLVFGIGFNLLFDKKVVKVGNLLPAILIPVFYHILLKIVNFL
ncbi:MAG: DUF554 domain-containing protein [Clostridia bacterium]|nr:DUF554 domain-containing protein [Clostridia bacterium]